LSGTAAMPARSPREERAFLELVDGTFALPSTV
jgi:hypothetical protein